MELRRLRQFVTLAETLNFHRAAEHLHMAQPPLTVSIRKLEADLGAPLFDRSNRTVRLTQAGEAALASARTCLFHAEEMRRTVRDVVDGLGGTLRIAFVGSATYRLLPRLIPRFREEAPGVKLELVEATNSEAIALLQSREAHLGFVRTPFAQANNLDVVEVERDTLMLAVPLGHRLSRKKPVLMADLREEVFVHYAAGQVPGLYAITMKVFEQAGYLPTVAQEAVQVQTVMSLVESGLGVALVPSVSRLHSPGKVALRPIKDLPAAGRIGISLAFVSGSMTAAARRFHDVALEVTRNSDARRG